MRPPYDYGRDKQGKCLVCLQTGEHDQTAHERRRLEDFPPAGEPTAQPEETSSEIPLAIQRMMESHPESADQILAEYQAGTAGRRPVVDPAPLVLPFTPRETDLKPPRRVFGFPDED